MTKNIPSDKDKLGKDGASGIYVNSAGEPLGLISRLALVMNDLPDVKPTGRNPHFGYSFIQNTQILGLLRPRLARQHIMLIPDILSEEMVPMATARGGTSWLTKMTVRFTFMDGFAGETISGTAIGYGDDSGDKGANKAFTAALKNYLLKAFLIGGETDIEEDAQTDARATARATERAEPPTIAPSAVPGVGPGGKTAASNRTQIREVGRLSSELELGAQGLARFVETLFGIEKLDVPEDPTEASLFMTSRLQEMSAENIGTLITALRQGAEGEDDESR